MLNKFKAYVKLTRAEHGLLVIVGILIGIIISHGNINPLFFIPPFFVELGAFALNDYMDYESDKINKRDRPITKGDIKKEEALIVSIVCFFISLISAFSLNMGGIIVIITFIILSILYDIYLKKLPLIGNMFIAFSMAIPFIYAGIVVNSLNDTILYISLSAFFIGLGREIIKTIEDIKGDLKINARTLPIVIGIKSAKYIAYISFLLFIPFSILAYMSLGFSYISFIMLFVAYLTFIYALYLFEFKNNARASRKAMFITITLGLITYLLQSMGP